MVIAIQAETDNLGIDVVSELESSTVSSHRAAAEQESERQNSPLAIVGGEALNEVPRDLYIPPDALEVFLEAFEGPLDLLLYLIKRQNIDVCEINVADITEQYMAYVELMQANQFELAAEYLVMAATLAEIKSRTLLPRPQEDTAEEDDPRMQLIRRLQEYERFRQAAEDIDTLVRMDRDIHQAKAAPPEIERLVPEPPVELDDVLRCLSQVLRRAEMFEHHHIQFESLSTREKMSNIMTQISGDKFVPLVSLFLKTEGRLGVVVTFLAVMELMKASLIEIVQSESFGPIHIKSRA
ncbi:MAG: ScpA family protein [Gammaproteobacteria bacterium]|nr:ScpA family protein [Gammaproteobacteria bacterium]